MAAIESIRRKRSIRVEAMERQARLSIIVGFAFLKTFEIRETSQVFYRTATPRSLGKKTPFSNLAAVPFLLRQKSLDCFEEIALNARSLHFRMRLENTTRPKSRVSASGSAFLGQGKGGECLWLLKGIREEKGSP